MAMKKNNAGVPRSKAAGRSTPAAGETPSLRTTPSREELRCLSIELAEDIAKYAVNHLKGFYGPAWHALSRSGQRSFENVLTEGVMYHLRQLEEEPPLTCPHINKAIELGVSNECAHELDTVKQINSSLRMCLWAEKERLALALRIAAKNPQPKARIRSGKPDGPKAGTPKNK